MMKYLLTLLLFICAFVAKGHVGSPGVTLEGEAGPYKIMVLINPPDVIPGIAKIDIYTDDGNIDNVSVMPIYWFAGSEGTPKADPALPVPNEPGHYKGELWMMVAGSSSVEVTIEGSKGVGKLIVPVMAVSTAKKSMGSSLGITLSILGIFLVILLITIIGLSTSDSKLVDESQKTSRTRRKKLIGSVIGFIIISLVLYGGRAWWNSWSNNYNRYMYKPWEATSTVTDHDSLRYLTLTLNDMKLERLYTTRKISYIVPDHGKIMHMFLVKTEGVDAFAHIHPERLDTVNFQALLPPLPAGDYYVYADISRLSGFSETIVDTVTLPEPTTSVEQYFKYADGDDTFYVTDPIADTDKLQPLAGDIVVCGKPGQRTTLPDGSFAIWEAPEEGEFYTNRLYPLTFAIFDEDGEPADLEPYLGMMGHAVILKEDGSVYIHLHPVGSYSTASQQVMQARFSQKSGLLKLEDLPKPAAFADSVDNYIKELQLLPEEERDSILMVGMDHDWEDPDHPDHAVVRFPYSFPTPGKYRIFIQMKRNGRILNSAFDVDVKESMLN